VASPIMPPCASPIAIRGAPCGVRIDDHGHATPLRRRVAATVLVCLAMAACTTARHTGASVSSVQPGSSAVRQSAAGASSGVVTGGAIGQASPAGNELNWVYRGTLPVESIGDIDATAYAAWAGKHGFQPAELVALPLLGVSVAGASMLLFDINKLTSNEGNLAAFVQSASGARIVYDAVAVLTDSGIAVRVPIDAKPYVIALAAPGYSIVAFQSGGAAPQPMTVMPGTSSGTGWAVFPDPTPAGPATIVQVARCQASTCSAPLAVPVR
jgi:hypothetical protein